MSNQESKQNSQVFFNPGLPDLNELPGSANSSPLLYNPLLRSPPKIFATKSTKLSALPTKTKKYEPWEIIKSLETETEEETETKIDPNEPKKRKLSPPTIETSQSTESFDQAEKIAKKTRPEEKKKPKEIKPGSTRIMTRGQTREIFPCDCHRKRFKKGLNYCRKCIDRFSAFEQKIEVNVARKKK